jgi:hypothetical protein
MKMETGFGWIQIGDERYEHDIILHVDGKVSKRQKKMSRDLKAEYGHTPLSEFELDFLEEEEPDIVIVGIGQDAALPVTPKAKKILEGYHVLYFRTPDALEFLSNEKRTYVAILHVTC